MLTKRKPAITGQAIQKRGPGRPPLPFEKRRSVVEHWLQLGNISLTANICGVSREAIYGWMGQPWWDELVEEIKTEGRITTSAKIKHVVAKSLEAMQDRLENGELVLDQKSGEMVRRPVALRDATTAAVSLMQRQAIIEKQEADQENKEATKTIQEQLSLLATEFAKFNNRSKANAETIEFREVIDAVHDQREEGLQEGSGEVYEPSGGSEEEGGAEQGSPDDGESWEGPQG